MVWGAIAYNARSPLELIRGTMKAQRYVHDILQPHVLPLLPLAPSTRQCLASHGKGVTGLSPHCYYPSLAYPIPRFVYNRAYLGSFGTACWASHEFERTRGKVTANRERNVSRYHTELGSGVLQMFVVKCWFMFQLKRCDFWTVNWFISRWCYPHAVPRWREATTITQAEVVLNRKRGAIKAPQTRIKDFINNPDEKDKTKLESKMDTLKSLPIKLSDNRNEYYEVVENDSDLEPSESEILDLEDGCEVIQLVLDDCDKYALAADVTMPDVYMDDILTGADDLESERKL
ncbi:transposable element Tcb1 transposase [Trichonephila clavipes]|nr:transposable element Tcb1 transposase [Trichonephila clavipes]